MTVNKTLNFSHLDSLLIDTTRKTAYNWGFALWWADEQRLYICIPIGLLVHWLGRSALIPTTTQSPKC